MSDLVDNGYGRLAKTFRDLAMGMESLADLDIPPCKYINIGIQPADFSGDATAMRAVDTVAEALLGKKGKAEQMLSGSWHYAAALHRWPLNIDIYCSIDDPTAVTSED